MRTPRRAAWLAPLAAIACGGPRAPIAPAEPRPEVKTYGPLGSRADAKLAHRAVILGTDPSNGSTLIPLPAAATTATVDALYVKLGEPAAATGGVTHVKMSTAPSSNGTVQVGIYEERAGGTGPLWRAGVWISAFVAATTLNKDLTDFTFSASSSGTIDGASASGLMAAGFLAAMTGTPIDSAATMTGIINPDGTIGPVAGIPEKVLAAIEHGKKRIGFPIGMRVARSAKSGADVDLVALARQHGAQAIEVADVHEAFALITGKTLPAPVPVSEADMALDAGTVAAIDGKYRQWQQRLATEWAAILQLESAGRLPAELAMLRDYSKDHAEAAERLHRQGLIGAAYARMLGAWAYASSANQIYDVLHKVQTNRVSAALAALAELDTIEVTTNAVFDRIGELRPPTMGGHLQMMAAFRAALRGWAFKQFATQAVTATRSYLSSLSTATAAELGSEATAQRVVALAVPTILYVKKTLSETTLATEQLDFQNAADISYMCSIPNVRRLATSFQSAGAAGLNYFDTLLVEPFARSAKLSEDEARRRVAIAEPDYLVAMMSARLADSEDLPKRLRQKWGDRSLAWNLLALAGSELAYFHSAELIAKHYSLAAPSDGGQVERLDHHKALTNMLATAERSARASARAARIATGAIPVQAKLAYQLAAVERGGTPAEQLDALAQFWASSAYSQTAVMLARN